MCVCVCVYIYIYTYIHTYVYMCLVSDVCITNNITLRYDIQYVLIKCCVMCVCI